METSTSAAGPEWTILKLLRWTTAYFQSHRIDSPRSTAELLLARVLEVERIDLYVRFEQPLTIDELQAYKALIRRRLAREPVAYIVGNKEFWSLELNLDASVLIPRPETECLVESALAYLPEAPDALSRRILELGVGSGAISIALASERPDGQFVATDVSPQALRIAAFNTRRHVPRASLTLLAGDWFDPLASGQGSFDVIVSNPPYIPSAAIARLAPEIHRYEPLAALDGGRDGLCAIRQIVAQSPPYLGNNGVLLLEIGSDQADAVRRIAHQSGQFETIQIGQDYGGHDRVAVLQKK